MATLMPNMRFLSKLAALAVLSYLLGSCALSEYDQKLDRLEKRIEYLETVISRINDNATAANALYRKNLLIAEYQRTENGYDLTLSDGEVLHITFGIELEGVAPIVGFDSDGNWVISTDGGETFSKIGGSATPIAKDGVSPKVNVNSDGFWIISTDGGETWSMILNDEGDPISAKDGKMASGSYSFFSSVKYNSENNSLAIKLVTGEVFEVKVAASYGVELKDYGGVFYAYAGQDTKFECKTWGLKSAVWEVVPEGWRARLEESTLTITAPKDQPEGDYVFKLIAVSDQGLAKKISFRFKYKPSLMLRDDFGGDCLNEQYWSIYKANPDKTVRTGWDLYQEGDPAQTFVKDGYVTMLAEAVGDTYQTGGVTTKGKFEYYPPFRIDISARYTRMAQGAWFALWTVPVAGYYNGEIDIVEKLNFGTETYHTVHNMYTLTTDQYRMDQPHQFHTAIALPGVFNTYSVEVRTDAVEFYLNDTSVGQYKNIEHKESDAAYQRYLKEYEDATTDAQREDALRCMTNYFYNYPFVEQLYCLIFDMSVGGSWSGPADPGNPGFPGQFDVDWVEINRI